jgi:hypothetical protein
MTVVREVIANAARVIPGSVEKERILLSTTRWW